jgi:hypothetical protein
MFSSYGHVASSLSPLTHGINNLWPSVGGWWLHEAC